MNNKIEKYYDKKGNASHYKANRIDAINKYERVYGTLAVMNFCEITAERYKERIGKKDNQTPEQELLKISWYEKAANFYFNRLNTADEIIIDNTIKHLAPWDIINNDYEFSYKKLLKEVLKSPIVSNRNQDTYVSFAKQITADLSKGFPMLTSKKMFIKNTIHELKWMLNGDTNTKYLKSNKVSIWDAWANKNGDLGPVYGKQMRNFAGIDQIKWVLKELKNKVRSRRAMVTMWNPAELKDMKLPPCHYAFNFVLINGTLNLSVSMRSLDLFVGLPYDISFYALMLHLFCNELNLQPGVLTINAADCHIYTDHKKAVLQYLEKNIYNLPQIVLPANATVLGFDTENVLLNNYEAEDFIKAKVHA
jgi:thymidylate synthase